MVAGWKKLDGELLAVEMIGTSSGLCTWRSSCFPGTEFNSSLRCRSPRFSPSTGLQWFAEQIITIFSQDRVNFSVYCWTGLTSALRNILEPPRYFQFLASQRTVGVYVGLVTPFLHDRKLVEKIRIFNVVARRSSHLEIWTVFVVVLVSGSHQPGVLVTVYGDFGKNPHFQRGARAVRT